MGKIILEDTRQKDKLHINIKNKLEDYGYQIIRTKILVGDYTLPVNQKVSVDTKKGLQEVCSNIIQDHERFVEECLKAQACEIKLYILIEDPKIYNLYGVKYWYNPRLRINPKSTTGATLMKAMITMQYKYGIEWVFSKPKDTARKILELLGEIKNEKE